jgi:nucleoid DNA-binding protein
MDAFSQEKTVKVVAFGTFIVRKKAKRMGRNPKTKEEVTIGERHTLVFKPSKMLKDSFQNTVAVAA